MVAHLTSGSHGLGELVQLDRHAFAAKFACRERFSAGARVSLAGALV